MKNLMVSIAAVVIGATAFADGVAEPNVIAYWPFGEYGFRDASGNDHDLEADSHVKAKLATGYVAMDGLQTYFNTVANLEMTGSLTIEFFTQFNLDANQAHNGNDATMILELGSAVWGVADCGFCIDLNEDGYCGNRHGATTGYAWGHGFAGCILAQYKHENYEADDTYPAGNMCEARTFFGPETTDTKGDQYFNDGEWHHVAVFFDDSKGDFTGIRILVDHEHEFTAGDGYLRTPYHPADGAMNWDKNSKLNIGLRQGGSLRFIGFMDDLRISSGILTTDQLIQTRTPGKDALSLRIR